MTDSLDPSRAGSALPFHRFDLGSTETHEAIEQLAEAFALEQDAERRGTATYFETFDWRLFRAGVTLSTEGTGRETHWILRSLDGRVLEIRRHPKTPGLADSLPGGAFEELASAMSMRRLLPLAIVDRSTTALRLLDDERKTVVRLWIEQDRVRRPGEDAASSSETPPPTLRLQGVRGYDGSLAKATKFLTRTLGLAPHTGDGLSHIAAAVGRAPGDYSSKPVLELDPQQTAGEATRRILQQLVATIETNEDGTRRDLDSEFLHDFRVAVRRTRSALSQVKGIFDPETLEPFRLELKWLGGLTGPTRDLDVYLLKFGNYEAALPESVRDDLRPLHRFLVAEQRREQRRLARTLASPRYRQLLGGWRAFLADPANANATNAGRPVIEVASERIWKVYRRIVKRGRKAVEHQSPAEEIHDLRIECKKLRYLLEFFRSLYDSSVGQSIKDLKRLQDNLGDFNDYEVQRLTLSRFADKLFGAGKTPVETFLAMGRLQAHLEAGQDEERLRFATCFAQFTTDEKRARFRDLFAPR